MRLTAFNIRRLSLPPGIKDKVFFDDNVPGFGLRIRASGARTWVTQYAINGRTRRMFLGSPEVLNPGKARDTAKDILAAVRLGRDPAAEKMNARARAAETFGAILPRYLERQKARLKPRSYDEIERHLNVHAKPLHPRPVVSIDRRTVAMRLVEIEKATGPATTNHVRASLSGFFTWATREGLIENNPVTFTNKAIEGRSRDRLLSDDELVEIWRALTNDQYSTMVKLLLLTGTRRSEIGGLRWSEVDLDEATIALPAARTKNSREHKIPLSDFALAILSALPCQNEADGSARDLVFGLGPNGWRDWSGPKTDLDSRILAARKEKDSEANAMPNWHLHDFRRVVSTTMHERLGVMPHIVEAVLGHVDGHRHGVAGVYNVASYVEEKRIALDKWSHHIESLVSSKMRSAQIVELHRRK